MFGMIVRIADAGFIAVCSVNFMTVPLSTSATKEWSIGLKTKKRPIIVIFFLSAGTPPKK